MKYIFIVGYMHSGTTLLQNIIAKHSLVFNTRGESKYFESLPILRTQFKNLDDSEELKSLIIYIINTIYYGESEAKKSKTLFSEEKITTQEINNTIINILRKPISYCSVFRDVVSFIAQKEGYCAWLEKTPTHILHVEEIVDCMPNAKIIEIIRDPRDILASKKIRRKTVWTDRYKKEQQEKKHWEKAYDPVLDTLSWKSFIRTGQSQQTLYSKNMYRIKYEELTKFPEKNIRDICNFLELEFEENMLKVHQGIPANIKVKRQTGISSQSNGQWKNVLTQNEVAICQKIAYQEIQENEYKLQDISFLNQVFANFLYLNSIKDLGIRIYRRWKLGGMPLLKKTIYSYVRRMKNLK